jgi:methionine-rich copper-binding protein CopC
VAAVAAALFALALALAPAAGASAHDYLVDSTPKAGSTQTEPLGQVSLTFNDVVLDLAGDGASSLLQVTGPDGASTHFETGCPTITDRVVTAPVALGGPGVYRMTWQIVSADGHTVSDSIEFTYSPPAGTSAAKGSDSRPACGRAAGDANTGATSAATPQASENGTTASGSSGALIIVIVIAGVIVLLAIVAVVVLVLTRRRPATGTGNARTPHPDDD